MVIATFFFFQLLLFALRRSRNSINRTAEHSLKKKSVKRLWETSVIARTD